MIVIIDNYDSFTYNIYQSVCNLTNEPVTVLRSKECSIADIEKLKPSHLIVSPGPGRPEDAGISVEAIKHFAGKLPILGVCLGHQAIGYAFGAKIVQAKFIKHGIAEEINLDGRGIFRNIGKKGTFTRYHSLIVDENTLSADFEVTARATDGDIMGIRHKKYDIEGVQFHPESIASKEGDPLFKAFLNYRRDSLPVTAILNKLIAKEDLDQKTAELFMETLTDGLLDERQTAAILTAIAAKGPAASEIAGCAAVLCRKKTVIPFSKEIELTDIVGTGGDSKGSFNISSMSSLIAAACGLKVAKHGNRAVSSKSGAADFFEAFGIKINAAPEKMAKVIEKTNFGFLFAPVYHSAMRFAGPVRKALGIKTIMNLIGPLSNPANAKYLMLGVYSTDLLKPVADAAKMLGAKRVMVITSEDGFDEISPMTKTFVYEIDEDNQAMKYKIDPAEFGIPKCDDEELGGGTAKENIALAKDLLQGKGRPAIRYASLLNAAAALYVGKQANSLKAGYEMAKNALDSGAVEKKIEEVIKETNS